MATVLIKSIALNKPISFIFNNVNKRSILKLKLNNNHHRKYLKF